MSELEKSNLISFLTNYSQFYQFHSISGSKKVLRKHFLRFHNRFDDETSIMIEKIFNFKIRKFNILYPLCKTERKLFMTTKPACASCLICHCGRKHHILLLQPTSILNAISVDNNILISYP